MNIVGIFILAFALSLDAFVVAFLVGLLCDRRKNSLLLSALQGFFQFLMPILGYFLFEILNIKISEIYAHIFVFLIFLFLGLKFIYDGMFYKNNENIKCDLSFKYLLILSVSTSIDAFFSGVSFSLLNVSPLFPSVIIGFITLLFSIFAFNFSRLLKFKVQKLNIIAGILLILLAIKTLF